MSDELSKLRAELEAMRRRVELCGSAQRLLQLGLWERDLTTGHSFFTEETRHIYGLDGQAELTYETVLAMAHPEDRSDLDAFWRATLDAPSERRSHRHRVLRSSGEVRWLETYVRLEPDAPGRPRRIVGATVDRTAAEREEEARRADDLEYRWLVATTCDGVFVAELNGVYVNVDDNACKLLGYTRDELLGMSISDVVPFEEGDLVPLRIGALSRTSTLISERRLRRKDGSIVTVELSAKLRVDGKVLATVRDVTARRQVENERRQNEETLAELGANLPALLWVRDAATGALLYANVGWSRFLAGRPVLGATFRQLSEAVHPDDRPKLWQLVDDRFDEVVRFVDREGSIAWFRMRAFPICDARGKAYRIAGFAENITEQRGAEQALRDSEARYRSVILAMTEGIVVHGPTGEIVTANPSAERVLGLTLDQLQGRTSLDPGWRAVHEDGSPFPGDEHPGWVTLQTGAPLTGVIMGIHHPDGALRWLSINSRRVSTPGDGGAYSVVASFKDITEARTADERIRASLREKEILLQEVHHRVKNNLQIISSLLYLQGTKADTPRFADMFKECQNRVTSMALIHETLYRSSDLSRIPFATYVRELGRSLWQSHGVGAERVALVVAAAELVLSIATAVPCGLMLNEILSNSLKHAFAEEGRGTVRVALELGGDDVYRLVVTDDGAGLPADFDEQRQRSLGTKLIDRLVAQIGGSLTTTTSDQGTRYAIAFPRDPAASSSAAVTT